MSNISELLAICSEEMREREAVVIEQEVTIRSMEIKLEGFDWLLSLYQDALNCAELESVKNKIELASSRREASYFKSLYENLSSSLKDVPADKADTLSPPPMNDDEVERSVAETQTANVHIDNEEHDKDTLVVPPDNYDPDAPNR